MAKITITDAKNEIMGEWIDGDDSGFNADFCVEAKELPSGLVWGIITALRVAREAENDVREKRLRRPGWGAA